MDWCISRRRKKYTDLWPDCFKSIAHRIYITIKVIKNSILMFKYLYLLLIWTSEKSISSSSSKSHWLAFLMVATAVTMDAAIVTIPAKIQIIQGNPKLCKSGFRLVANSLWSATKTMDPPRINRPINKINIMNMINNIINNYCVKLRLRSHKCVKMPESDIHVYFFVKLYRVAMHSWQFNPDLGGGYWKQWILIRLTHAEHKETGSKLKPSLILCTQLLLKCWILNNFYISLVV